MSDLQNGAGQRVGPAEANPAKKQKKGAAAHPAPGAASQAPEEEGSKSGRFKIATRVIMAMKRFQASLNPTYSYGKRSSDGADEHTDGHRVLVQPKAVVAAAGQERRTSSGRTTSGRTLSGRPASAGQQHGYKANLLFRALPDPDTAVKSS